MGAYLVYVSLRLKGDYDNERLGRLADSICSASATPEPKYRNCRTTTASRLAGHFSKHATPV